MKFTEETYRLVGREPLLGSIAMDPEIFSEHIATKAKTEEERERAKQDVENVFEPEYDEDGEESNERLVTGFYRDVETGNLLMKSYQVKGFFKEACKALSAQLGIGSCVSKVDNFVFIEQSNLPIMRDGEWISKPDSFCERSLRGMTARGPRISIAKSEQIEGKWYVDITVRVVENKKTPKSIAMSMDVIEELLTYGKLKGLLQWRNAGYGSFDTYKKVGDEWVSLDDLLK